MLHDLPIVNIPIAGKKYKLYVAISNDQKMQGLSGVSQLKHDEGMLFPYDDEKPRTFQFRETLLPLKVYFIGGDGKVLQRSSASPGQEKTITCPSPCKWVIELLDGDRYYAG